MEKLKAALALLGAALITGGVFGLAVRMAKPGFDSITQNIIRFAAAAVILLVMVAMMRKLQFPTKREWWQLSLLVLAAVGTGVFFTIAVTSIKLTTSIAVLYVFSILLATVIDRVLIRKASLGWGKRLAVLLAIAGLLTYANPLTLFSSVGVLAAAAAGACDAVANAVRSVMGRDQKQGQKGLHRFTVAMYQYAIGVPIMIPALLTSKQPVGEVGLVPIIGLAIFAIASVALGVLLMYGLGRIGTLGLGTVILSSQLVFAALTGALLLAEPLNLREVIALLLLIAASTYGLIDKSHWLSKPKEPAKPAASPAT